jgi:hypothetical protein
MGHCTSVTDKKRENSNKIIINNALINNTKPNTQNITNNNYRNSFSNTIKVIITDISLLHLTKEIIISIKPTETLKQLYEKLKINTNYEYSIKLQKNNYIITNVDINKSIIDILYSSKENINEFQQLQNGIYLSLIYKGLEIPENIIESYIVKNPIIGSPIFDNPDYFAIITFNTKNKELKIYNYEKNISENFILNKFNSFTAYCNGNGYLFISGGENDQNEDFEKSVIEYNDFFCLDLNQLNSNNKANIKKELNIKQLPNLLEPRTWHSMIFVPEKYVFIVGGSTQSVELYDIEKNELTKDSELNEMRSECTLCMVNNVYLYTFCGFHLHETFNCTVERCNLRKSVRFWEYVKFDNNNDVKFIPSFFCVSYYKKDEIILFGGNDSDTEKNKSYIIKIGNSETDEINEFNNFEDEKFGVFRDKLFTPIDNNYSINIPIIFGERLQLFLFNMNTGEIEYKYYNDIFNLE